jgi:hypothetical protein
MRAGVRPCIPSPELRGATTQSARFSAAQPPRMHLPFPHTLAPSSPPSQPQILDVKDQPLPSADAPLVLLEDARMPPSPLAGSANASARQFHARLAFTVPPPQAGGGAFNFTVGARLLTGPSSWVDVLLEGAAAPARAAAARPPPPPQQQQQQQQQQRQQQQQQQPGGAAAALTSLRVAVDKRHTGGFTPAAVEGGAVPLPAGGWALPGRELALDLWLDHSVLEVYAMGGLARVTSRIYPSDESTSWGLAAFGAAAPRGAGLALASAQAWALANAWAGQPALC